MCSIGDDGTEHMEPVAFTELYQSVCRKCSEVKAQVVLQSKFAYCRTCFLSMVSHKYRSTLGKSKVMKHGDKVLVAFSGNDSSVCLLDMIQSAKDDGKKKKINTEMVIVFIDERPVKGGDEQDITSISESLKAYEFPKYYCPLDSIYGIPAPIPLDKAPGLAISNERIEECLQNCKSRTSAIDLLKKVRHRLLYLLAKDLGCNKIFLPETNDDSAVNIISNIALGRGDQLPLDVGFMDDRRGDIVFLRPLCEISKKEVAFYNAFKKLDPIVLPSVIDKVRTGDSMQSLTENFITNIGVTFPSTVHTIVATGTKLLVDRENFHGVCGLCEATISTNDDPLSSAKATELSSRMSALGDKSADTSTSETVNYGRCSSANDCCSKRCKPTPSLCYSCLLIAKDFESTETWPPAVRRSIDEESSLEAMRMKIEDYLL
ncbi:Cytoplasmic tRNA 2-thiolation protein 2 [Nesidiocoris tenuis]|uniref:Cytoplasmic tRNA 2-thiolation protein 2 n=1 Tax=Nesidiocoris tenuis TaxID=355587 RepID=A0ABN7B5E7_9HEMI|nr:Cytoplasmic tRNA 2-thiolation protein 2 [Nesidiocoris tenuis]